MNKINFKTVAILIVSIFAFSGCISLTKEFPKQKTYTLTLNDSEKAGVFYDKTVRVFEPKALSSLNTKSILYSKSSIAQEKYALSRWSDKPSKMLQQLIAKHLTSQNKYKYITTSNIKVNSDYKILSELVDFKQTFTKTKSYAEFSIRVYLINNKTNKVYFKSFSYNKLSDTNNARGLVYGINNLSNNFLLDLHLFIQNSIKKDVI